MKKYKILFSVSIIFFYLLAFFLNDVALNSNNKAQLKDLNMDLVDLNKTLKVPEDKIFETSFTQWGLRKSFLLRQREEEELKRKLLEESSSATLSEEMLKEFKLTNRVICLNKQCWEFMGIVKVADKVRVTLLSKEKKGKLKMFYIGDYLLEGLKIIDIKGDTMNVLDEEKKESFKLKLFDIDPLKYLPKKVKKKDINE